MSVDRERWKRRMEEAADFQGWEEEDVMDVRELQEVEVDITDLIMHILTAYKRDEIHILNDAPTESLLIIIPAMETSE